MKRKSLIPILYEDAYLFAINKPPRVASVPSEDIPLHKTVLGMAEREHSDGEAKPYLLHRLDFATTGILLFGKHERDRKILEQIVRHPDTHKKYVALVKGVPSGKLITQKLKARASEGKVFSQTGYRLIRTFRSETGAIYALVEAEIKTGRKHQIRQHFAAIGHPVLLDSQYGDFHSNRKFRMRYHLGRQFLHAAELSFFHPFLKKEVRITAPLTPDLQSTLKKLQRGL